ncbi:tRNA pseudouridine(55) synthase TruB [Agrococcus sp. TF02-05]|uniref:tRNA pseudouridine(55) synthase TruB n=1 Tax=Agrococcus sp. TF02-05 TaxID=2815211 RepID=UPI001AA1ADF1|nr:tRNA pseudouridine(55) synthase TruB [Agrococcus sp. TF02-05]MBO1769809.1 tRNA pseudouridine(55) synthase TruB [Agrococcus sp. TF02-05]
MPSDTDAPDGILLVDKPQGITSHTAVSRARRALGTRKVGHAGTLDPMATGLLILGVGPSTRLLTHIVGLDKTYTATIALGATTTTDDAEGDETTTADASHLTRDDLTAPMAALTGEIEQVPSSVSAIKVDGERAYARVRAGEEVELAARPVTVSRFEVLGFRPGVRAEVDVVVDCSSGTYIRALARDLGAALGVGGHLTALRRSRIGPFEVEGAPLADALPEGARALLEPPARAASRILPVALLDDERAANLAHGRRTIALEGERGLVAAVHGDRLVGIARAEGRRLLPVTNFPTGGAS